jgi:type II secretion system protein I
MMSGFTLLEVMAALMIMTISFVVLVQTQTESLSAVNRIQNHQRAVMLCENQLYWTMIDLNQVETWEELASLSGFDGDYQWTVVIREQTLEEAYESDLVFLHIIAEVRWPEGRHEGTFSLDTHYLWGERQ